MQISSGNLHAPCTQLLPRDLTLACDLTPWSLARGPCAAQLNLWSWVNWTPLHNFAKSTNSSERQGSVVSARDVSRDFFRSRWASPWINLVCLLLGWPFYNFKSSTSNGSGSPFERRRTEDFENTSAIEMAKPGARLSLRRSPLSFGKKRARSSSFNQWQRHLRCTFAVS